ncbi:hypothetical protein [Streptomyces bluensis]|uniref:hypothetical protein n=1 Tax=Streptomyces bluensis TaxID=33897 RepID=UPI0010634809|nr:hypothetical protein [Streptomyces bluensis]GGZ80575.1 hypothetical protein GCM10010344_54520 [Streptomyces bluensis]
MGAEADGQEPKSSPHSPPEVRLLPWTGAEGKPCYLITDEHAGPVSRLADTTESVQLGMGRELLAHADDILPDAPRGELRFLAECLTGALRDALRVADSRGRRLKQLS